MHIHLIFLHNLIVICSESLKSYIFCFNEHAGLVMFLPIINNNYTFIHFYENVPGPKPTEYLQKFSSPFLIKLVFIFHDYWVIDCFQFYYLLAERLSSSSGIMYFSLHLERDIFSLCWDAPVVWKEEDGWQARQWWITSFIFIHFTGMWKWAANACENNIVGFIIMFICFYVTI